MRITILLVIALLCAALALVIRRPVAVDRVNTPEPLPSIGTETIKVDRQNPLIRYDLDPAQEKCFIHLPKNYNAAGRWGAIIFMHSADQMTAVPSGWNNILAQRKLIFIAPQNAGNNQAVDRRLGLALLAAQNAVGKFQLDPDRIYVAGLSGGARIAGCAAFYHPEIFKGTIQCCGTNFPGTIPRVHAAPEKDPANTYGQMQASPAQIEAAKKSARFVLITGSGDFRHGNILDLYEGGFRPAGFQALLLDIPQMGHTTCDGAALSQALDFIESK